ncbi:alanine/glycine:cation symporter family protein [Thiomicrorhabdus lithotrophica]|uniref:Sodium:alanine symporter family protein n=1 Tax=Thiomicrorhabdus lithotrophica TaxID=2949997 RepID=A0ABY8CCJ4_9GAMM|nr:sodium:alanine symporter family protein [Thiomicrorhabdus lithotrophica]WEJ62385.1 sodium:alanine symporter family protein [Thiomicrorhabdus lithotrophica]
MESINAILSTASTWAWGPAMLILLLGTGVYLTIRLKFLPLRNLFYAFSLLWKRRTSKEEGDISPFGALMTAMSATVGTGNIAGVAAALFIGGPGAIFWMWMTALVGMATKYGEAVLAVKYREVDDQGCHVGGPMYYIKNGMGEKWKPLAFAFAMFGTIAAFGIGNMVQANAVAGAMESAFEINNQVTGLVLMVLVGLVLFGGIKRIAHTATALVPIMAVLYITVALYILIMHADALPAAFATIIESAFTGSAAAGGFAGAGIILAIQFGVARGVFSNEAGMGTAPIAHAAAKTNNPVEQGHIAMLGTFIDTIILCTMTALVIMVTGVWTSGETGSPLTALAFTTGLDSQIGAVVVAIGLAIFAFTTLLGWSYYGEKCAEYIAGTKVITGYRILWVIAVFAGAALSDYFNTVLILADVLNALMAIPNLIALLVLSPIIIKLSQEKFK